MCGKNTRMSQKKNINREKEKFENAEHEKIGEKERKM